MPNQTLGEYIYERDDWGDLSHRERLNVVISFVNDLEGDVRQLNQRVNELEGYL